MRTCPQASFAQWLRVWRLISRKMGSSTPFPRPRPIDLAEPRSNKLRTRLPTQQERLLPTLLLQVRAEVTKLLKPSVAFGSDGTNGRLQQRQVAQHFLHEECTFDGAIVVVDDGVGARRWCPWSPRTPPTPLGPVAAAQVRTGYACAGVGIGQADTSAGPTLAAACMSH